MKFLRTDILDAEIKIHKRYEFPSTEVDALLKEASVDSYLGEFIYKKNLDSLVLFSYQGKLVGFSIPRKDSDGHYRTGPIYVTHGYRRKGIAKNFTIKYFQGKKGRAWIEESNIASKKLFTSIGFKKTGKKLIDGKEELFEYIKD